MIYWTKKIETLYAKLSQWKELSLQGFNHFYTSVQKLSPIYSYFSEEAIIEGIYTKTHVLLKFAPQAAKIDHRRATTTQFWTML